MNLQTIEQTIGKHPFLESLTTPVITLGKVEITRQHLIEDYQCGNMHAATSLAKTLKKLHVATIEQLAKLDPASLYRVHGCGHTQVYVAMCLLDHHGIDVGQWWGWEIRGGSVQRRARQEKKKRGAHDTPTPPRVTVETHA